MYEYKVFRCILDSSTVLDFENELNYYAKEGYKISNILSDSKESTATVILERKSK
ncbi:DUF4177 domain-containing protein [Clostridium chrysemydis]|uniref:DUF4177 domain-containing protein n=1 Tax=Clostridium chrysemydis TaxID=2665504 RepID=UPI0018832EAD|nr:DUF4177 domain-containing protein [Clostridium chrysemydis]